MGTDFWFGFMENDQPGGTVVTLEVYVTSPEDATINIENPSGIFDLEINVAANTSELITIPVDLMPTIEGKTSFGLHLTSDVDVSVYTLNMRPFSADATVILPTHVLGNEYWVMAHVEPPGDALEPAEESEMLIVATEDNTSVEITPSVATYEDWQPGVTQTIILNAGETYQIKSDSDLTGTYVKVSANSASCAPIAVFGGSKFTNVGGCGGNLEHLIDQMLPPDSWGKDFLYVPYNSRQGGDYVKILAREDGTSVIVSEMEDQIELNSGEFYAIKALTNVREISSNKPIQIGQFSRSGECDNVSSDPFMILLSPIQQRVNQVVLEAFDGDQINSYHATLITSKDGVQGVNLDGKRIAGDFNVHGDMAYATIEISKGTHNVTASEGVIAYVYGFGQFESYGYSAGRKLEDLSLTIEANGADFGVSSLEVCPNSEIVLEVFSGEGEIPVGLSNYSWKLGDGTTKSGDQIVHTYSEPGDYFITLTAERDPRECGQNGVVTITRKIRVTEFEVQDIAGPVSVCSNVSGITYSVEGSEDYDYEWVVTGGTISGPSTLHSISVDWGEATDDALVAVTVHGSGGCVSQRQLTVTVNKVLTPAVPNGPAELCFGDYDEVEYLVPEVTNSSEYSWFVDGGTIISDNNDDRVSVSWDGPGTPGKIWYREFNPTISDCEGISEVLEVHVYSDIVVDISTTAVQCFGEASGSVNFEVSGGKPGDYRVISGGNEIEGTELTGLKVGNYTVTIIDALGCREEAIFAIDEPQLLEAQLELLEGNVVRINVVGGIPGYEYSINGLEFQESSDFSVQSSGTYEVTVRDANDCTVTVVKSFIIASTDLSNQPAVISAYPNPANNELIISRVEAGDVITLVDLRGLVQKQETVNLNKANHVLNLAHIGKQVLLMNISDRYGKLKFRQKIILQD